MSRSAQTIPIASAGRRPFSIPKKKWPLIEKAYGHSLSKGAKRRIGKVTRSFVRFEAFERAAAASSVAKDRVKSVKQAAIKFSLELHKRTIPDDAHFYANYLIKKYFDYSRLAAGDKLHNLIDVLDSVISACNLAIKEMSNPDQPGFREGECWDQWVRELTRIVEAQKLPSEASKGSTKLQTDKPRPSPFVRLVIALHKYVPGGRHTQSPEALAGAIHRARRGSARKK